MPIRPCHPCKGFWLLLLSCLSLQAAAQLNSNVPQHLTLQQADSLFLVHNYQLLAERYNLSGAEAQIIQAKLWDNPNLSLAQGAYYPEDHTYFNLSGPRSENAVAIQQLFRIAGKRGWQIRMARTNYQWSRSNFYDLIRTLDYSLHSMFFDLYFQHKNENIYRQEIKSLQETVHSFSSGLSKGYISQKEFVRMEALLLSLQSEYSSLQNEILQTESDLSTLLGDSAGNFLPVVQLSFISHLHPGQYSLGALIDSAFRHRPDLEMAQQSILLSHENLSYQKSLAVPDLTLGASYDKRGSYIPNYNAITLSFDLPIFNRNQGNIKAAKARLEYEQEGLRGKVLEIENRISTAYMQALNSDTLTENVPSGLQTDFRNLAGTMLASYKDRTINLLEFIDFFDAYKETSVQINTLMDNKVQALVKLNYECGISLYTF